VPGINLEQNSPPYKFTHHSEADTLDKVEPDLLIRNATVMAVTAFWIADRNDRVATAWSREKTAQMLVDKKQDVGLKAAGLWPFGDVDLKPKEHESQ
jgi:hypothetical protein